jgi:hypothetical protein
MRKKPIKLTAKERAEPEKFCAKGVRDVGLADRAKMPLAPGTSGERAAGRRQAVAGRLGISRQTAANARRDFLEAKSLTVFLQRKRRLCRRK